MVLNDDCARPLLARGKVRFVGDMVAAVVATTRAAAVDAAELVEVDYDPLEPVVDPEAALADGPPLQFEELGSNLAAGVRDPDDVDPLEGADVVVRARHRQPAPRRRADGGQRGHGPRPGRAGTR